MPNMPTFNLGRGFFDVLDDKGKTTVWLRDFEAPCSNYRFELDDYFKTVPPISEAYDLYTQLGYSSGEIMDELIRIYLPLRLFRVGDYENLPICLGLIGNRGSGKTAGAVSIICLDFMFRGLPCYSNIPIAVRVAYKNAEKIFLSQPLNKLNLLDLTQGYQNGVVLLDEVNMEAGEATRSMSTANLQLSYVVQQIRKRQLSMIWTCQGFMWVDNRLRWQLDYAVSCTDAFLSKRYSAAYLGERSVWQTYDLSGLSGKFDLDHLLKHRHITDFGVWQSDVFTRPWWFAYNTYELKGQDDYITTYRTNKALKAATDREYNIPEDGGTPESAYIDKLKASGLTWIYADKIWEACGVAGDKAGQTRLGQALKKAGYLRRRDRTGYYYQLNGKGEDNA